MFRFQIEGCEWARAAPTRPQLERDLGESRLLSDIGVPLLEAETSRRRIGHEHAPGIVSTGLAKSYLAAGGTPSGTRISP